MVQIPHQFIIMPEEIEFKLSRINCRKAPRPDGIRTGFLRDVAAILSEPVCGIFHHPVQEWHVPAMWKKADVVPVPTTRPLVNINNDLRLILLTHTIKKVLKLFVAEWMLEAIGDNFDEKRFGGGVIDPQNTHWSHYAYLASGTW